MSAPVNHYGSQYGHFLTDLYASIRAATFGQDSDIGQNSWLTVPEQDLFIKWLSLTASARLLDVACGTAGPTLRIAQATGCSVVAIDSHADAMRTAQALADERGLADRASFRQTDASRALPFDDESFDAVICIDAINHLPDRSRVFAEWRRVLNPGGRLVFTDPTVVTGPLTSEEIAVRASIGFFLFVPDGADDRMLASAGFEVLRREDRTENVAAVASRWRVARAENESALRAAEGDTDFAGQQSFLEMCARLAGEQRLSRIAYAAVKSGHR